MKLNTYNSYEESWGWYVDTENNLFIDSNIIDYNSYHVYNPYKNKNYSKIYKIEEDEYEYYKNNYKDIEDFELEPNYYKNITSIEKKPEILTLYKICSTTLITALLAYTIFFLI